MYDIQVCVFCVCQNDIVIVISDLSGSFSTLAAHVAFVWLQELLYSIY